MKAHIIDGRSLSEHILEEIHNDIKSHGIQPGLATIVLGDDPMSHKYVSIKEKIAHRLGYKFINRRFPSTFSPGQILKEIEVLNSDVTLHGLIVQLPLPESFERHKILKQIHPYKDVDGLHPKNLGLLIEGHPVFLSPFTLGVLTLISATNKYPQKKITTHFSEFDIPDLTGVRIVLIGNGLLVGRPLSIFFAQQRATVTIINQATPDPFEYLNNADIVITGTKGKNILNPDDVKEEAILISGGEDIDDNLFTDKNIYLSPNRGGIGPLTVAHLLRNTLLSAMQ